MVEIGRTPQASLDRPRLWCRRWLWGALAALIAAGLAGALLYWWRGPAVPVVAVTRQALVESVAATGRLQAPARIELGAELAGTVARVWVREGQRVGAGELLVSMQDAEARAALVQAQAAEQEAAARVRQQAAVSAPLARQSVLQAEAAWRAAEREHGRVSELVVQGFFAPQRLDEARRALDVAGSVLASAQLQAQAQEGPGVEVALALARLAQAQANVRVAQARLERLSIRSPVPARVLSRQVEPGALAQPGRVLLVLAERGSMHIEVSIDERHLPMLRLGIPAWVVADAYPDQPFDVHLCEIAPALDAERGSITVRLCLQGAPEFLKPEMTVSAELVGARREAALVLPTGLVREADKPAPWVLVLRQGRAQRATVRLGLSGIGRTEVLEGLREGDLVIAPTQAVLPGDRVRAGSQRSAAPAWSLPSFFR